MNEKQKILLCGDVEGKFKSLFTRVENINKKSGPFDLLLCVGNFFGINNREFEPFKTGERTAPISTYILGPNEEQHANLYPTDDSELCPNVYYLGKRGLYTSSGGLKIAYISGISIDEDKNQSSTYSKKDITELFDVCAKGNSNFRGVDILLTSQWPNGIANTKYKESLHFESDLPAWLLMKLKPRYHISGLEGLYYEHPPFRSPNLTSDGLEIVTRFIGLARVGNVKKDKWIYALSLTPLEKMKISELLQKTTDEVPCPFNFIDLEQKIFKSKRKLVSSEQYFYDASAAFEPEKKSRGKRQKIVFDQSKCWFCLGNPSVEKHLIISVGNSAYLTLAKGGLVDEHFLICSIEHYQSMLEVPENVLEEIEKLKDAVSEFYKRNEKVSVFFERNYKTSHMQLQAVPVSQQCTKELKEIFMEEAEGHNFQLTELDSHVRLNQVIPSKVPYFTVELPSGIVLHTKIATSCPFPLNFGREVLITGPVLNLPDRAEWKDCILKREEEELLVQRIRTDFEPFDFTL